MGLFGDDTKKETRIVLNFDTYCSNGSAIGITNRPIQDKGDRFVVEYYGRDYNESDKNYTDLLKEKIPVPARKDSYYINSKWSEYKPVDIILPSTMKQLPIGLHPDILWGLKQIILRRDFTTNVEDAMLKGLKDYGAYLQLAYSLEYPKDMINQNLSMLKTQLDTLAMKHNMKMEGEFKPQEQTKV